MLRFTPEFLHVKATGCQLEHLSKKTAWQRTCLPTNIMFCSIQGRKADTSSGKFFENTDWGICSYHLQYHQDHLPCPVYWKQAFLYNTNSCLRFLKLLSVLLPHLKTACDQSSSWKAHSFTPRSSVITDPFITYLFLGKLHEPSMTCLRCLRPNCETTPVSVTNKLLVAADCWLLQLLRWTWVVLLVQYPKTSSSTAEKKKKVPVPGAILFRFGSNLFDVQQLANWKDKIRLISPLACCSWRLHSWPHYYLFIYVFLFIY